MRATSVLLLPLQALDSRGLSPLGWMWSERVPPPVPYKHELIKPPWPPGLVPWLIGESTGCLHV